MENQFIIQSKNEAQAKSDALRQELITKFKSKGMTYQTLSDLIYSCDRKEASQVLNVRKLTLPNYLLLCQALNVNPFELYNNVTNK